MGLLTNGGLGDGLIQFTSVSPPPPGGGPTPVDEWLFNNSNANTYPASTALTDVFAPTYDNTIVYEGSHSAKTNPGNYESTAPYLHLPGAFTVQAAIYPISFTSVEAGIVTKWLTVGNQRAFNVLITSTGVCKTGFSSNGTVILQNLSTSSVPLNAWTLITFIYVPSTSISVYFGNVLAINRTSSVPAAMFNSSALLRIGAFYDTAAVRTFNGYIDRVRIYNEVVIPV